VNYTPVRLARLYEQIVEQIEDRIRRGELRPGHPLPSERELAEQFGVSRTTVREAIKALREKGLVEVYPGRGTLVVDNLPRVIRQSLQILLGWEQTRRISELMEVRELLEPSIAALAAERATEEHLEAMRRAVEVMDASFDNAEQFVEADLDFHLALAEATGNSLIPLLLDPIIDLLREHRIQVFRVGGAVRGQLHHKRILEAVLRRDPEAARAAMIAHLHQIREDSARISKGSF
jgi:GntR family transcriptional repressor for pyruvate dehydrogenase complex